MKRFTVALLLPLLFIAQSGSAAISRLDLDKLAEHVWHIRAAFHTYTVMQGDQEYNDRLEELISDAGALVDDLQASAEPGDEQAFAEQLSETWQRYQKFAESNTVAEMGYNTFYAISDLEKEALAMSRLIDTRRTGVSSQAEELSDLAVRLLRITSEYMSITSSTDGGGLVGTGADEGRLEFVEAVPDFDSRLAAAQKTWADNPDISRELRSVASKWAFIRESLVKFYENSVPFVVQRYSGQMVDALNNAADMARQAKAAS